MKPSQLNFEFIKKVHLKVSHEWYIKELADIENKLKFLNFFKKPW